MGERTIQDVMNEIESLIKEAAGKGFKINEIHPEFLISTSITKKYTVTDIKFTIVKE